MLTSSELAALYIAACETELQAFKPGNVSIYAVGHGMTVTDFRVSAEVSAPSLCNPNYSLGEKIYYAVKATREAVGCNTNLGILLLCAPVVQAVLTVKTKADWRQTLSDVLATTTLTDADWVFRAISLASPGGLGNAEAQDVREAPTVTLAEAMALAADKDRIALQYVSAYKDILENAVLRYNYWLGQWRDSNWAAVFVYAELLSQFPDSHIERKHGKKYTEQVAVTMRQFIAEYGQATDTALLMQKLYCLDTQFKAIGVNPGTTADMTVATVLSALIDEHIADK